MTQTVGEEIDVLWLTAGLGCDGDTISMTAATQPSLEDLVLGALPGIPRLRLHNPVLAYANGADFLRPWHDAAEGKLSPFLLVVEGSIPNEHNKTEGYWAGFGSDPATGQPITTCTWIDRLAPKAWAVVAAGTCSAYGGIHAMAGNPTGCMGLPDYLGWQWKSTAGIPIVCVPGCPVHPDNFMEVLLYLLYQVAGKAPMIPLDDKLRPTWLFGNTVHEGCDRAFASVDCAAVFWEACANLQAALEESKAELVVGELPTVLGNAQQLMLLFQNLVGNAVKFRDPARPVRVEVGARRDGDRWLCWVRDNGIGIEARHLRKVFGLGERLHTASKYPGTGFGLAICEKIVAGHGGRIWVESEPGQGSTFSFTFPGAGAATPPPET